MYAKSLSGMPIVAKNVLPELNQKRKDSHRRRTRKGQSGQSSQDRTVRMRLRDRTARKEQPGQDSPGRTARTVQSGRDCREKTARTGQPG